MKEKLIRPIYISAALLVLLCWTGFIAISWHVKDALFYVACVFALLWCAEIIWCILTFCHYAQGQDAESWLRPAMLKKLRISFWLFVCHFIFYIIVALLVLLFVIALRPTPQKAGWDNHPCCRPKASHR